MRIRYWSSDVCSSDLDGQRDIGLEQRDSHFAHRGAHVGLGQRAATAQLPENIAKPIAQTVEHLAFIPFSHPATQKTPVSETSPTSATRGQNFRRGCLMRPPTSCRRTRAPLRERVRKSKLRGGALNANFTAAGAKVGHTLWGTAYDRRTGRTERVGSQRGRQARYRRGDRKSTRLNSRH